MKRMIQFHKDNITEEWQDLVNEFPEFFLEPSPYVLKMTEKYAGIGDWPDKLEECVNLRFGFELDGTGWKGILFEHFYGIRDLIKRAAEVGHKLDYKACILKEKFGTCRNQGDLIGEDAKLYYKDYNDLCWKLEERSAKTCMITGTPGKIVSKPNGGWVRTLCEEKAKELGYVWDK
jgi:hypothetical protein